MDTLEVVQTASDVAVEEISIYSIRTKRQRNLILMILAMIAFLLPFCDTIYLPSLKVIEEELNTTDTAVTVSVSVYLVASGLFSLVWGPISDRFGRKITLVVALTIFIVASIVCIFAPNIIVFIAFRVVQGGTVSATLVVGQGSIADIYPEEQRGSASGFFFVPFNIGAVVGPLIGGALSSAFGWRSTFIFLTVYSFIVLIMVFILMPETHQYFAKERFHKANDNKRIIDASPNEMMPLENPLKPLTYLADLTILPYIALRTTTFAALVCGSTLFSIFLSEIPYGYTATIIGVLYLPGGVIMLIANLLSGWSSDKASNYYKHERCLERRLVPSLVASIFSPIGLIIFGWTFQYKYHVIGPIIGNVLFSFGQAVLEPSVSAYLTSKKRSEAAAVSAANTFINLCVAGIFVGVAILLSNAMGIGPYFSLLASLNIVTIGLASTLAYKSITRTNHIDAQQSATTLVLEDPPRTTILPRNEYDNPDKK